MKYILSTLFVISIFFQFIENVPLNQSLLFTTYGYNKNSTSINLFARSINEIDVDTFAGLDKLEVLYLHDNKIAKIDSLLFKGLSNLRELWLESNNIVTIDKNAFGNLTNLELVCLNDNPLSSNFPGIVSSLCSNSPRCVLKVTEKCLNSTIYEFEKTLLGHTSYVYDLIKLNSGMVVSASADKTIRVWNESTGQLVVNLVGHSDSVGGLALLDETSLVSGSKEIIIWNTTDWSMVKMLKGHTGLSYGLAVLLNNCLASGSHDSTIKIWDLNSGTILREMKATGPSSVVYNIVLLKNNSQLASSYWDGVIRVWDYDTGRLVQELFGHTNRVFQLRLLENGNLISCSDDNTIKIWRQTAGMWRLNQTLTGHTGGVTSLKVSLTGNPISGSRDKSIKIWDLENGKVIQTIPAFTSEVWSLLVLNQNKIMSGSSSGQIRVWNSKPV